MRKKEDIPGNLKLIIIVKTIIVFSLFLTFINHLTVLLYWVRIKLIHFIENPMIMKLEKWEPMIVAFLISGLVILITKIFSEKTIIQEDTRTRGSRNLKNLVSAMLAKQKN